MNFIKNLIIKLVSRKEIDTINRNLALLTIKNLIKDERFSNDKSLIKKGYKIFSQQDEDGIIDEIFKRIGCNSKKFVEIGLETGKECNTTNLLFQNWSGLWIESNKNHEKTIKQNFSKFLETSLKLHFQKLVPSNVNEILLKYFESNEEIDLLSIDIGFHTYHVLEGINVINPRVIVTEYNAKYGPLIDWKVDYDPDANWDNTDYYGASLFAFEKMLKKKNYFLVGCNVTGANAFFVRKDQLNDKFEANHTSNFHFIEGRYWLKKAFDKNYTIRLG